MTTTKPDSSPVPTTAKDALTRLARASKTGLISVELATKALRLPRRTTSIRLAALARRGWLRRVRRGLYLVLPLEVGGTAPTTVEDPWVLALELFAPCYIGGWSAAGHWGLTEQLFRSTFVVSARRLRRTTERILGTEFRLVGVPPRRLKGIATVWRGRERVSVSDRERTIADALVDPSWIGGIRHLADILRTYRASEDWEPSALLRELTLVGTGAAFKRLGFLTETLMPKDRKIIEAARARRTTGIVKLDPAIRTRGKLSKRWGLWVNASVRDEGAA
jgi:predicted transcriptional regulator of viral defense system